MKSTLLRTVSDMDFMRKSGGVKLYDIDIYKIRSSKTRSDFKKSRSARTRLHLRMLRSTLAADLTLLYGKRYERIHHFWFWNEGSPALMLCSILTVQGKVL